MYSTRIEEHTIQVSMVVCKRVYAVYRTPLYKTNDGCIHSEPEELFNVYTDQDVAELAVRLINENN